MLIQVSSVVSTTSSRLMPSMPTWYLMPKNGIQDTFSWYWKPGSPMWKPSTAMSESAERDQRGAQRHAP